METHAPGNAKAVVQAAAEMAVRVTVLAGVPMVAAVAKGAVQAGAVPVAPVIDAP